MALRFTSPKRDWSQRHTWERKESGGRPQVSRERPALGTGQLPQTAPDHRQMPPTPASHHGFWWRWISYVICRLVLVVVGLIILSIMVQNRPLGLPAPVQPPGDSPGQATTVGPLNVTLPDRLVLAKQLGVHAMHTQQRAIVLCKQRPLPEYQPMENILEVTEKVKLLDAHVWFDLSPKIKMASMTGLDSHLRTFQASLFTALGVIDQIVAILSPSCTRASHAYSLAERALSELQEERQNLVQDSKTFFSSCFGISSKNQKLFKALQVCSSAYANSTRHAQDLQYNLCHEKEQYISFNSAFKHISHRVSELLESSQSPTDKKGVSVRNNNEKNPTEKFFLHTVTSGMEEEVQRINYRRYYRAL